MSIRKVSLYLFAAAFMALFAGSALAQDSAYSPVTNFTGTNAGFNFRQAINQRLGGQVAIQPLINSAHYSNLPAEADGDMLWCADCKDTTPCASGGSGAWAFGTSGQWSCGYPTLNGNLNLNGFDITGVADLQLTGSLHATANPTISASPYSVASSDLYDDCNAASGAIVLNLPAASGSGRVLNFKKTDSSANACTLTPNGTDKIDGSSTLALSTQYQGVTIRDVSTGKWDVINPQQASGGGGGGTLNCTGTGTLVNGMATVSNACISASAGILLTAASDRNHLSYNGLATGTFNVVSDSGVDNATFTWGQP